VTIGRNATPPVTPRTFDFVSWGNPTVAAVVAGCRATQAPLPLLGTFERNAPANWDTVVSSLTWRGGGLGADLKPRHRGWHHDPRVATFSSVRSANRAARTAARALQVGLRPVPMPSRLEDPPEKMMWGDGRWATVRGGRGFVAKPTATSTSPCRCAMSVPIAVLQSWHPDAGLHRGDPHYPTGTSSTARAATAPYRPVAPASGREPYETKTTRPTGRSMTPSSAATP
jgi:hypothetical protein